MKCFYHNDKDAVGICKSCNKGLCPDCAVDTGNGLACKETCESKVKAINELIEKNIAAYAAHDTVLPRQLKNVIYYGWLAFIISGTGLIGLMEKFRDILFLEIAGLFLFAAAAVNLLYWISNNGFSKKTAGTK